MRRPIIEIMGLWEDISFYDPLIKLLGLFIFMDAVVGMLHCNVRRTKSNTVFHTPQLKLWVGDTATWSRLKS
ncbi:hypothetical protein [Flammeovirga aprica]|uniref:Uncharacterized protein n=1 Tax=Flammeovirga aprica JL-4 TaxID=694437 RepID=A0A7X9NYZ7_9BACT|nr:hypothetical protein [Flammeovirga aprica]NME66504.1 hypothetical protein [Flammeovirga aprica JL-4]